MDFLKNELTYSKGKALSQPGMNWGSLKIHNKINRLKRNMMDFS